MASSLNYFPIKAMTFYNSRPQTTGDLEWIEGVRTWKLMKEEFADDVSNVSDVGGDDDIVSVISDFTEGGESEETDDDDDDDDDDEDDDDDDEDDDDAESVIIEEEEVENIAEMAGLSQDSNFVGENKNPGPGFSMNSTSGGSAFNSKSTSGGSGFNVKPANYGRRQGSRSIPDLMTSELETGQTPDWEEAKLQSELSRAETQNSRSLVGNDKPSFNRPTQQTPLSDRPSRDVALAIARKKNRQILQARTASAEPSRAGLAKTTDQKSQQYRTATATAEPSSSENGSAKQTATLYVRIHDVIEDMRQLGAVLTSRVKDAGVELYPTEDSITRSSRFTFCSLFCENKTQAKYLQDLFYRTKVKRMRPRVECRFTSYKMDGPEDDNTNTVDVPEDDRTRTFNPGLQNPSSLLSSEQNQSYRKPNQNTISKLKVLPDKAVWVYQQEETTDRNFENKHTEMQRFDMDMRNQRSHGNEIQNFDARGQEQQRRTVTPEDLNQQPNPRQQNSSQGQRGDPRSEDLQQRSNPRQQNPQGQHGNVPRVDLKERSNNRQQNPQGQRGNVPRDDLTQRSNNRQQNSSQSGNVPPVDPKQRSNPRQQNSSQRNGRPTRDGKNNVKMTKEDLQKQAETEIETFSARAMRKHNEKVEEVEKKIDAAKENLADRDVAAATKAEIAALESKWNELLMQEKEFRSAVDGFRAKLMSLVTDEECENLEMKIKNLRKGLGVECCRLEKGLPVYGHREEVVSLVRNNQVSILLAETGSGKSTQVVQYLYDAGLAERGIIVCAQPRRVAADSLATHVAQELASTVGGEVGLRVGTKVKASRDTRIMFMTDYSLLDECLKDPDLNKFSCVVVDEAHERNLFTDLLLTMVKRCLTRRDDLKVIITSATIDPEVFVRFFNITNPSAKLEVHGRAFPVEVVWEESASEEMDLEDYVNAAVNKAVFIHNNEIPGDILVFLTSAAEIQKACDMFQRKMRDRTDFQCLPLHGQLQPEDQRRVFERLEGNKRKVVFATNCAETSITIDGIRYVVDAGVAKEMHYEAKKGLNALRVSTISRSSADQRKGRAGRTAPGKCYRLYTQRSYRSMDAVSTPEILKTHLGHALLKLAELGVTPDMYDFVQSPPEEAIKVALQTLCQLGALQNNAITDVGRWIARLPFEPRLGLMTLLGHREDLLYDAVVLASILSVDRGLFYRGSTDAERKKCDIVKMKFSQTGGDALTAFQVYKAWKAVHGVPNQKKWCKDNCINNKTIRGVKDGVFEIVQMLRREAKIEVKEEFSQQPDVAESLRKMVFQVNASNLCHFLGREKAGYFAAGSSRQVHIHPSSVLCSQAITPQWVVYHELLQTSRDFITGVTPVDESWLQELSVDQFGFEVDDVRSKRLDNVFTQPAGSHAFFAMVGMGFKDLRSREEIYAAQDKPNVMILEASRDTGEVRIWSMQNTETVQTLKMELEAVVAEAVAEVEEELREVPVGKDKVDFRVLLGQGGQVEELLMPQETRKVFITRPADDTCEETIREKFGEFGRIVFLLQFAGGRNWGLLIYRTAAEAEAAVEGTKDDEFEVAQLERSRAARNNSEFKANLRWCRRFCKKGLGFVELSPAYVPECLGMKIFNVGEAEVSIRSSNKSPYDCICLRGLPPDVTEDLIERSLLVRLGLSESEKGVIERVTVVRDQVGKTDKAELKQLQKRLENKFQSSLTMPNAVQIWIRPLNSEQTAHFHAEARFKDPIEGFEACKYWRGRLTVNRVEVEVEPIVSAIIRVPAQIYNACKEELDKVIQGKLAEIGVTVETSFCEAVTETPKFNQANNRGGRRRQEGPNRDNRRRQDDVEGPSSSSYELRLKAMHTSYVVRARTFLSDVIKGDVLDCNNAPTLRHLLTPAGRWRLKKAEKTTAAFVKIDNRTRTVAIYGSQAACTKMRQEMNQYLDDVLSGTVEEIILKGAGRPPGVLKSLLLEHGDDLEQLRQQCDLLAVDVDYRRHKLKLTGTPENLQKAREAVEKVNEAQRAAYQLNEAGEDDIDCAACFCPIERNELNRLQSCGHAYCKACLRHQVSVAVRDRNLPVLCCQEGCDKPLAWRDFQFLERLGHLKLSDLADSALATYIQTHRDEAQFCVTPDCPMVYRVSPEDAAKIFSCPCCHTRVCTACHTQAHEGMTCIQLRSAKQEAESLDAWIEADKDKRRVCPNCAVAIEKTYGCNKMVCSCKTIFCWLCCEKFPTSSACYDHLVAKHGGVFDANIIG